MLKPQRPQHHARGAAGEAVEPLHPTAPSSSATSSIPPLLTRDDLAATLRVDIRTLDRLRSAGRLPAPDIVLSRSPRWLPGTIEAWLAQEANGRGGRR
jgi:hypothetical protein